MKRKFITMVSALFILSTTIFAIAETTWETLNDEGGKFYEQGKFADAIDRWTKAIEKIPDNNKMGKATLFFNRAYAYLHTGQMNKALEDFNTSISLNPNFARAYNGRGMAYLFLRKGRQVAGKDFTKAIELDPNYAEAYVNRAALYKAQGDEQEWQNDLKKACDLGSKSSCEELKASAESK